MRVDGDLSFIVGDRLGSTSAVYNTVTNTVSQRWFEPFGQPRYMSGTIDTDIGFTGQRADAESGLMFYNARYYDPAIGRFISPDSIVPDPANPKTCAATPTSETIPPTQLIRREIVSISNVLARV